MLWQRVWTWIWINNFLIVIVLASDSNVRKCEKSERFWNLLNLTVSVFSVFLVPRCLTQANTKTTINQLVVQLVDSNQLTATLAWSNSMLQF